MVQSIDNALITEFSDMVHHESAQRISRLRPYVVTKQMSGDVWAYDGLGNVEAREVDGRNVPATFDDIEHTRRKIARKRYVINLPIDSSDVRGALLDPQSEYAKVVAEGMMREYDRVIYRAAFADVLTGRDFATTVSAADDGVLTVDATAGLTYAKILEVRQNFFDEDVGHEQDERLLMTIGGREHTKLMQQTELTSGDFTSEFVIEGGKITKGVGFDFIPYATNVPSPIIGTNSAGTERELLAMASRGVCLAVSKEMSIKIQERPDLIETTQVQVVAEIGAVRTEGVLVQKIRVTA